MSPPSPTKSRARSSAWPSRGGVRAGIVASSGPRGWRPVPLDRSKSKNSATEAENKPLPHGWDPASRADRPEPTSRLRPADIASEPEPDLPCGAIGVEQRRREVGVAGREIGGVTAEGGRELRRRGGPVRLVQRDGLASPGPPK